MLVSLLLYIYLSWITLEIVWTGAMDTKLLEALYWKGLPVFDMESHMSTVDVGWGSPTFHKMGREKVILINSILPFGVELLMCDTDMVWLKVLCSVCSVFLMKGFHSMMCFLPLFYCCMFSFSFFLF